MQIKKIKRKLHANNNVNWKEGLQMNKVKQKDYQDSKLKRKVQVSCRD